MNLSLPATSPGAFVKRTLAVGKSLSAIVSEPEEVDETLGKVRATFAELKVRFIEAQPDAHLSERREALKRAESPEAVVLVSMSPDQALWRGIDKHRSRLQDNTPTLWVLTRSAAESLQQNAPHLASSLAGAFWACEPQMDPALRSAIDSAASGRYLELYEATDSREPKDLEEMANQVIAAFGDARRDERAWRRLGVMARAMLVEVLPTISGHWPGGVTDAKAVLAALDTWLASASEPSQIPTAPARLAAPQALAEAMDVVQDARRVMERPDAGVAAAGIVDACLQGYAIFPGSAGRRALFDWWLHKVVPAAWALRQPPRFERHLP